MQIIRRTAVALTATLVGLVAASGTAFAAPKPLAPSDPGLGGGTPTSGGGSASTGGFLDSWAQVTLTVLVVSAIVAIAAIGMSRLRHHAPSTA